MTATVAAAAATAITRRRQQSGERAVFVKAEQQSNENRQSATAKNVGTENTVFRAENEQSNQYPKGDITLRATIHK